MIQNCCDFFVLNDSSKTKLCSPLLIGRYPLFIKFLEDNHIINLFFYKANFPNEMNTDDIDFGYKSFLKKNDINSINKLFNKINKIFNITLFQEPIISSEYLTDSILDLIYRAIRLARTNVAV